MGDPVLESATIDLGPLRFDALVAGPPGGPLVLLLHGFPTTSQAWRRILPRLASAGYRAVAPDGRGLSPGARPPGLEAYRVEHLVADVIGIADRLGAPRFHLVGHDWGGITAWQVASRHPRRLRSLSVVSTPHLSAFRRALEDPGCDQRQRSAYFETFRAPGGVAESAWLDELPGGMHALYLAAGLDAEDAALFAARFSERAALTGMLDWYRADEPPWDVGLGKIEVPTLYCWGTEDPALGREAAVWTADFVSAPYRFEIFEGANHWLPEREAGRLGSLILEQLRAND
jgi:pimeloyl-ACP methyl ester carboxylesterase